MTSPTFVTVAIDEQSIDVTVPPSPSIEVTPSEPLASVAVHSAAIDVTVAAPPAVDVSTVRQPFTVITVEGPPGQPGPPGEGTFIARETPTGDVDGTNTRFTLGHSFLAGSTSVYLNGLLESFCNELSPNQIEFGTPPVTGDSIRVSYTVSG